jgi:hypothetical protein
MIQGLTAVLFTCLPTCTGTENKGYDADDAADVTEEDLVDMEVPSDSGEDAGCSEGLELCGESCVDTSQNHEHCGGCDRPCEPVEVCMEGECFLECPAGETNCSGVCADIMSDPEHCGSCENACSSGEVCSMGSCAMDCAEGLTNCSGACVDLDASEEHCGSCDHACETTRTEYGDWTCTQRSDGSWLQRRAETEVTETCTDGSCREDRLTCTMSCGCSGPGDETGPYEHRCYGSAASCCANGECVNGTYECSYIDC